MQALRTFFKKLSRAAHVCSLPPLPLQGAGRAEQRQQAILSSLHEISSKKAGCCLGGGLGAEKWTVIVTLTPIKQPTQSTRLFVRHADITSHKNIKLRLGCLRSCAPLG
jgi:hypothetical protein